jgi:vancomycin resistance protein YoaR
MNPSRWPWWALLAACTGPLPTAPPPAESASARLPAPSAAPSAVPSASASVTTTPAVPVLASYETTAAPVEKRLANLRLAASKLNGTVIEPGAEFSFNQTVGPRTKEAGFQTAPEFFAGVKQDGIGGGVCQVSSTLYGAARRGWLTVVRRYAHSRPVSYTPTGTDAAVSDSGLDLVLKNPYPVPLTIRMGLEGTTLRAVFEGVVCDFTVEHRYMAHTPEPPPRREIPSKVITEEQRFQAGKEGIAGTSVWIQKRDGVEVDRVVSISRYQPVPEIWVVPVPSSTESSPP